MWETTTEANEGGRVTSFGKRPLQTFERSLVDQPRDSLKETWIPPSSQRKCIGNVLNLATGCHLSIGWTPVLNALETPDST